MQWKYIQMHHDSLGAFCGDAKTHVWWTKIIKDKNINYLDMQAVFYGLKYFGSFSHDCEILLNIDNMTALSYINRYGSIKYP